MSSPTPPKRHLGSAREEALRAVHKYEWALRDLSEEFRNDAEIAMEAVKNHAWWALRYASPELKNNPGIVLTAVQNDGSALMWASEELKSSPEIVLAGIVLRTSV